MVPGYESFSALKVSRVGKVLTLTLDNPPRNTMTRPIHNELSRIFETINHDPETSVVVLTGAGESFSSGGDIKAMSLRLEEGRHDAWAQANAEAIQLVNSILRLRKPIIAKVNGDAMGVGATLVALSDLSFMLESARIADTHVKAGLAAGDGGALIWPFLMGFNRARRYLLTGDFMTGSEAAELGLVTESVKTAEDLDLRVEEWAQRLANGATLAINGTKIAINMVLRNVLEGLIEAHMGIETYTYLSSDHREALNAFLEKRPPVFEGK